MGPYAVRHAGLMERLRKAGFEVRDFGNIEVPVRGRPLRLAPLVTSFDISLSGQLDQGEIPTPLREVLAQRGRGLVVIGAAADEFAAMAEGVVPVEKAETMAAAVAEATAMASEGEAVVLAPACASFDQYRSYAQRGEVFTEVVDGLE